MRVDSRVMMRGCQMVARVKTCMKVEVVFEIPNVVLEGRRAGDEEAEEEVDRVLLLSVCITIVVESLEGGEHILALSCGLPFAFFSIKDHGMRRRASVLHRDLVPHVFVHVHQDKRDGGVCIN